ncbi:hypothetical protein NLM33_43680 [Bradyrhizobium sp. CCGUVB1N3]|uniref:hypothetical protein n=1 Tax=Bradyrhizobium sp. CCGUVB1N3 TaxID=2949629 RepID=UPI0020B22F26|nr:hypothetical protein [Bradyrhizobium sp. CCGUVB1N3]MCP3477063.1 hypothetical protein [Bradyrhizobium sp. CCGUVB1N3]
MPTQPTLELAFAGKMSYFGKPEKHLSILVGLHIAICCISLFVIARGTPAIDADVFHIHFRLDALWIALLAVTLFSVMGGLFVFCPFSIGYFVGFYFFSMTSCFLWLTCFSEFPYNHLVAGWSVAISCFAFLLPALLLGRPLKHSLEVSITTFDRIVTLTICLAAIVIASGAYYNFSIPLTGGFDDAREAILVPRPIGYLAWISSSSLLPFAFAYSLVRRWYRRFVIVVLLQLLLFPVTLTKTALFTPLWLTFLQLLSARTSPRNAVVLSLLLPMGFGLLLLPLGFTAAGLPFSTVNFRMLAIPALAMDIYNDFFSRHELTHFCQVSLLKTMLACPYRDQLSIVMHNEYHLGHFNASLFATEGIASVGLWLAPVSAFVCGVIVSFANRVSASLPNTFILVSGGMLPQVLLNVPLSVAILTHGAALLCVLWYLTPRQLFVSSGTDPRSQGSTRLAP